ncbi:carotenoid oxygenase family protein [Sphingosinicella sp. CPCC 101087]|uniref:carotenoid oxygenase family protein n=1 Tax=Sphingosinicella sp. CPCC 101087 TaxID=2497754 RepID=UPI00101C30CA|nr:carotenoid oxygenase family protein [Sphingosinicella sp. CPCC 101087]
MEIVFPKIPLYEGWGKPLRTESNVEGLELVEGHVPEGLNGTWYRAGPDRQFAPKDGDDIFIDGEGMAHMLRFDRGHVTYRSRWVRTERFVAQEKARRTLFGRYRNRYTADPEAQGLNPGTANTNMLFHAGKLTVLKEDDLPYEIDPDTLETGKRTDLDGQVSAVSLSAHPKLDLIRNEYVTYSFQAKGDASREMAVYIFGPDGKKVHELWFEAPWAGVVHDFAVTEEHIVIPFFPLITDLDVLKEGGPFYQWHDDKPCMVAVVPRRGTADQLRWFKGPTVSAGHMMNAVTDGTKVHLDVVLYHGNCFPFFATPDGRTCDSGPPQLTRMTMDLARNSDEIQLAPLTRRSGEMPRTDDRYQGRPYRHGFMILREPDGTSSVSRADLETGVIDVWAHGDAISVHEPQFVPRSPDSPEADGWLLVILNRLDKGHSELAIFDALKLANGPIARLHLPVRVRSTFHGSWVPAETLKTGRYHMEIAA